MHVLATAGHVDHGKSTLVRALTGMEPDRYAEERRRGLTIDLGFAWTTVQDEVIAFVDVPGHERFVPTMLAGVGPVPAVVLVVAADGGWMPQSQEHLDALDALGVRHGLLVITRCDVAAADPAAAEAAARQRLAATSLRGAPAVAVSATTGAGMDELRTALVALVRSLPAADPAAPVRMWVDRAFTITGAGTVVTGTLAQGTLRRGDRLHLSGGREVGGREVGGREVGGREVGGRVGDGRAGDGRAVVVRGLQSLGQATDQVSGPARVAVNLRGVPVEDVERGHALMTPGRQLETRQVDVRARGAATARLSLEGLRRDGLSLEGPPLEGLQGPPLEGLPQGDLPQEGLLHVGAAHVGVRLRPLGGDVLRLSLAAPLPLRVGDVGLLRDPGRHLVLAGVTVLDVDPPALRRRGAARDRAATLAGATGALDAAAELDRRRIVRRDHLLAMGLPAAQVSVLDGDHEWLVSPAWAASLAQVLPGEVRRWSAEHPLSDGIPVEVLRQRLSLPATRLVETLVRAPHVVRDGHVVERSAAAGPALPPHVRQSVTAVLRDLAASPFAAPDAHRLRDLGLGPRELAAAVRTGQLARVGDGIYLAPQTVESAATALRTLPQPFTLAQARQAWATTRRVALPLLALLDQTGTTRRLPDDTRVLVEAAADQA